MKIGYARVSTKEQKLHLQLDALKQAGCEKIFTEVMSRKLTNRPELNNALAELKSGDTLIVWALDRLGGNLKHLIELMDYFKSHKINFVSLKQSIDTSTSVGNLIFQFFGMIAEFELVKLRERTVAGLEAAWERGKKSGRKKLLNKKKLEWLSKYGQQHSHDELAEILNISRRSVRRYVYGK